MAIVAGATPAVFRAGAAASMHKDDVMSAGYAGAVSGAHCGPRTAEKGAPEQAGPAGPAS